MSNPKFNPGQEQNPTSFICVNPDCPGEMSYPHYKTTAKKTNRKCRFCGKKLYKIAGEPYGTQHIPRS